MLPQDDKGKKLYLLRITKKNYAFSGLQRKKLRLPKISKKLHLPGMTIRNL
jgi:hypothetical protein